VSGGSASGRLTPRDFLVIGHGLCGRTGNVLKGGGVGALRARPMIDSGMTRRNSIDCLYWIVQACFAEVFWPCDHSEIVVAQYFVQVPWKLSGLSRDCEIVAVTAFSTRVGGG